jgi:hypothetical protein
MHIRLWTAINLAVLTTFVTGCGGTEGLYSVNGKVLYKGEPAAGATVYFHGKEGDVVAKGVVPNAIVGEDGTFRLVSNERDGAPPGTYDVLIEWRDRSRATPEASASTSLVRQKKGGQRSTAKIRSSPSLPADRLRGRYSDISRPLLKAEIKPETNNLSPFELTD